MDASLKQRLIGAAVLVALAVIFLPMLISGPEPDAGTSSVPVDVPNRDNRDFQTRDLTLAPPVQTPAPSTAATTAAAASDDAGDRVALVDTTGEPPRIDAMSGLPVGRTEPEPAPSTPAPAAAPAPAPAPAPAAPAAAPPAAAPAASVPAASSTGRWAVNLGSYANATNATTLVSQLRQQRLPAYAEQVTLDGKAVQRVRLGPFAQRSEAESARLTVQRLRSDLPTGVVSLEGEAPRAAVRPAVAEGFAVQLGAFRSEADANALRDRARGAGLASYVERARTDSGTLWRVRLGPELRRADAERLKADAKAKLGADGNIVPHP